MQRSNNIVKNHNDDLYLKIFGRAVKDDIQDIHLNHNLIVVKRSKTITFKK